MRWIARVSTVLLFEMACLFGGPPAKALTTVPFVGCADSGQTGVFASGTPLVTDMPPEIASKLAVYAGDYQAVLAPRGWQCIGTQGTAGATLWVYPQGQNYKTDGPIVSEQTWGGNETGNSYIISYGGTYFPKIINNELIDDFLSGRIQEKQEFLVHKHKTDTIIYESNSILEFATPAGREGLGSEILGRSSITAYGLIGIIGFDNSGNDPAISLLGLRLPSKDLYLRTYILEFSKACLQGLSTCKLNVNYPWGG